MSKPFDEDLIMSGTTWWREKRAELKPVTFRLSVTSMIAGFLLAVIFGFAGAALTPFVMSPKFPVTISPAQALTSVQPGELLLVSHGISGECGPDGGRIIAEARPLGSGEWRTVKAINMSPINLEPQGALSTWRIPDSFKPGVWQARITVWCNRAPEPWRSGFRFSVLGALRG